MSNSDSVWPCYDCDENTGDPFALLCARCESKSEPVRIESEPEIELLEVELPSENVLNHWAQLCQNRCIRAGWPPVEKGTELMLIVSEVAEAMEGERKDSMDDKLTHRKAAEVELADVFIRLCSYCGKYGYDLEGAVREKLEYNLTRLDHQREIRKLKGGKTW